MAKKCRSGYHTVGQILMTPSKLLLEIKGFSDAKVEKVQEACRKLQVRAPVKFKNHLSAVICACGYYITEQNGVQAG